MNQESWDKEIDVQTGSATPQADADQPDLAEEAGAPPEPAPQEDLAATVATLTAERDRLAQEKSDLHDKFLRKHADFENLRKRTQRERKEFTVEASLEVVRALLPVLDGLERALSAPAEGDAGPEFRRGVELLHKEFRETLEKLGLEAMETVGRKFDPHIHHAVEMVETEEHEDHSILEEWQRGYRFQHRLLRPAMVRVAVRPRKN